MAEYRYFVTDLLTGKVKAELPLDNVQYSEILDRAGSFSGTIGTRHPKATLENLNPSATGLFVQRDDRILWGGILWTVQAESGDTGRVTLGAEGLWSYWAGPSGAQNRGRFLKVDKDYENVDQFDVARDLVSTSMADANSLQLILGGETSGQSVTRQYYGYERRNIGQEIQNQAAEAFGYDFSIESRWDDTGTTIENFFRLYYPFRGGDNEMVLRMGVNIAAVKQQLDGTSQTNSVDYVGSGQGPDTLIGHADNFTASGYPLLESVYQDTSNTLQWSLDAEAESALAQNIKPYETLPNLTLVLTNMTQPGSWQIGEALYAYGQDGFINITGGYRIMSHTISVDAQGGETVALGLDSGGFY